MQKELPRAARLTAVLFWRKDWPQQREKPMNGAQSLIQTLVNGGVDTCFTNPGTSEMHFVAAVDRVPAMRTILCLFEGGCTGAADGFARMAGRPAATLLHLGPGLGNGIANLHNARRAGSPLINIVGEHATYHLRHDAPLATDIAGLARPVSGWVAACPDAASVPGVAAAAVAAANQPPGQVATLILPADCAWGASAAPATPPPAPGRPGVDARAIKTAAELLRNRRPTVLFVGGQAMGDEGLRLASRICQATGARLVSEWSSARTRQGAGTAVFERLPYAVPAAKAMLAGAQQTILAGARAPVAFFAYPNTPSTPLPDEGEVFALATPADDIVGALRALADELGAPDTVPTHPALRPELPRGPLSPEKVWIALAALMPEDAIISDESITASFGSARWLAGAPPHDHLGNLGGSIGQGIPLATGAAVACPGRKVINTQADGSAMYTLQALWTQARERLDVVTLLLANRSYAILQGELERVGADANSPKAHEMLDLGNPTLDWVALANGMGVAASRASTAEALADQLGAALGARGPHLIEVVL